MDLVRNRGKQSKLRAQHGQRPRDEREKGECKLGKEGQHIWSRKRREGKGMR